ncbi:hypothetical protein GQ457_18G013930 [Hibiscus cannabinus]
MSDAPRPFRVADLVIEHRTSDWDRLEPMLPKEKLERIASIHPPRDDFGEDKPTWIWENMRRFSTRSAYNFPTQTLDPYDSTIWRRIWRIAVPKRIRVFLWLTFHECLLINVERVRRHLSTSELYGICGGGRESVDQVLRSCEVAKGLWLRVLSSDRYEVFFSLTFQDWLRQNLFGITFMANDEEWQIRFAFLCWLLWKRRCSLLLDSTMGVLGDVLENGNQLVAECSRAMCEVKEKRSGRALELKWDPLPVGWVKLNVDAAVSTANNTAGVGGVIRDANGAWLFRFARFVGRCDVLLAELWAVHDGLLNAWSLGYRQVELESDYLEAICWLRGVGACIWIRWFSLHPPGETVRLTEEETREGLAPGMSSSLLEIVVSFDPRGLIANTLCCHGASEPCGPSLGSEDDRLGTMEKAQYGESEYSLLLKNVMMIQ